MWPTRSAEWQRLTVENSVGSIASVRLLKTTLRLLKKLIKERLSLVKGDWLLRCKLKRLARRVECPWGLREFYRGVVLAFVMDLEHAVDTLFKVQTATMQALLQHLSHALRPVNQRVHLGQLPLRQALPARRERCVAVQFMEQHPHFSHAKADCLGGLDKCQSSQNLSMIASLSTDTLWQRQESHALIVTNCRSANARLPGYFADGEFRHCYSAFFPLDLKFTLTITLHCTL